MQTTWDELTPNLNLNDKHRSIIQEIAHTFMKTGTGVPDREKRITLGKDRALLNELTQHGLISNIASKYYPAFPSLFFLDGETRDAFAQSADWVFRALRDLYVRQGGSVYDAVQIHKEMNALTGRVVDAETVLRGMLFTQDFRNYFSNHQTSVQGPITSVGVGENIIDYEDILQAWKEELPSRPALVNRAPRATPGAPKRANPEPPRSFIGATLFPQEEITNELEDFLVRAALLARRSSEGYVFSFSSVLLAFIVGADQISAWFRKYISLAGISIDAIIEEAEVLQEHIVEANRRPQLQKALQIIQKQSPRVSTSSMKSLFGEAAQLKARVTGSSGSPVSMRHLMGAFIYRPNGHEKQLREWGFDREDWSAAFIANLVPDFSQEQTLWVQLHTEVFGNPPNVPLTFSPPESAHRRSEEPPDTSAQLHDSFRPLAGPSTHVARDRWTTEDSLGHFPYAYAIYRFLTDSITQPPLAISIQAPWGGGKTSLMRMIQAQLDPDAAKSAEQTSSKHLRGSGRATVGQVLTEIDTTVSLDKKDSEQSSIPHIQGDGQRRVSIWFNTWKYESTAQVWAGLADCIVQQIGERLGPAERELFWFRLHLRRLDAAKVRRRVHLQVVTRFVTDLLPRLWAYLVGPTVSVAAVLISHISGWLALRGVGLLGLAMTGLVDVIAATRQAKSSYSKVEREPASANLGDLVTAPDYKANLGFIHEVVEDLKYVFDVIPDKYLPMVIFIDDLDRCSPKKVAAVVEAVNLFLAGEFPDCMFILGIDDEMVAAALDEAHSDVIARLPGYARSASMGWRFMDKFVQLPFIIPPSSQAELTRYLESLLAQDSGLDEVDIEARDRAARAVEKDAGSGKAAEQIVKEVSAERHLAPSQEQALTRDVGIIQEMQRNIENFHDEESAIKNMIFPRAQEYFTNPRDVKRFVNLFRFYYFLRAAREARGEHVPSIEQMLRWLVLSLKWPEVVRWLRRATKSGEAHSYLAILERLGAGCQNIEDWRNSVERELALKADKTPWLSDEGLLQFFQAESALIELERLSVCGGMGLW